MSSKFISAPLASVNGDPQTNHYASLLIDAKRVRNNWPDRVAYVINPENVLGPHIAGQESWAELHNASHSDGNAISDEFCVVVAFGGTVILDGSASNNYRGSVSFFGLGSAANSERLPVSVSISDQVLSCDDPNWTYLGSDTPNQFPGWYGKTGGWGNSVTGTVRSVRISVYSGGGNIFGWDRFVSVDAIQAFGIFIPNGTEGDKCGTCIKANAVLQTQNFVGGPINVRTGNYVYGNTDLTVSGRGQPLSFRRVYSAARINYSDTILGPGWTHNYNMRLIFPNDPEGEFGTIIFQQGNGSRQRFGDDGNGNYVADRGLLASLSRVGSIGNYTYTLILPDQTRYQFNNAGQLIQIDQSSALSNGWNPLVLTYDANNRLARVTDGQSPNQRYLEFVYNASGRITEVHDQRRATDANSPDINFTYDGEGNLVTTTDIRNQTWTYSYQPTTHRLTKVTDPLNHVVEEQDYDPTTGRVTQQRNGLGQPIVTLNYTSNNQVIVTDGRNNSRTYTYNGQGAFAGVEFNYGAGLQTTDLTYDYDYRPLTQEDANGNVTNLTWDAGGETVSSITDASGNLTSYDFDPANNNLLEVTDARNQTTQFEYTDPNFPTLPTLMIDALGNQTQLRYTAQGYLSEVENANGVVTHYNYDAFGQRTQSIANYKDGVYSAAAPTEDLITSYGYNSVGRLTSVTDPQGHVDTTSYDAAGNITKTIQNYVAPGTYSASFPDRNIVTTMIYDAAGRLTSSTDTLGVVTAFVYNNANQLIRVVRNFIGSDPATVTYNPANPDRNIIADYQYDLAGNQTIAIDTLGRKTASVYDSLNRLIRVVRNFVGTDPATETFNVNYPDRNVITEYTYDSAGNQTAIKSTVSDLFTRTDRICYDTLNRPVRRIQNITGSGDPCALTTSGTGDQMFSQKWFMTRMAM